MSAIVMYLLYGLVSLGLVTGVGRALARSGRAVLAEGPGGPDAAQAASRLLAVAFYLLSAGFVALTLPAWAHVGGAGHALQMLSVKLGELLLVLGALHLASIAVLARIRRGAGTPGRPGWARPVPDDASAAGASTAGAGTASTASASASTAGAGTAGASTAEAGLVEPGTSDTEPAGASPGGSGPVGSGRGPAMTADGGRGDARRGDSPALWRPQPRPVH